MKLLNYIFLFTLFFNSAVHAQVMAAAISAAELKRYDLNKDGKIDRIEYYKNNQLIRIEEDRNSDEKFDYVEIHDNPAFYLVIEQDTNFDGKIDFKKSYSKLKVNQSKVLITIDGDFDGLFETSFSEVVNDLQKNADCLDLAVADEIENLVNGGMNIAEKLPGGFTATGVGLRVENECLQKWGSSFKETVKESVNEGMQCLENLPKESAGGVSGAQRNIFGLNQLFKDDKISLVCTDKTYDWDYADAYASSSKNQHLKNKNISHPYIVLNPTYPKKSTNQRAEEIKEVKATIFHEMLHNLGYRHSESIEFSYGCETCCFDDKVTKEAKAIACKICTGNYTNEFDPNYLSDFIEFGKETYKEDFALKTVLRYAKTKNKSLDSISLVAEAASGVFNPIGPELANLITAQNSKGLSPKEADRLKNAQAYASSTEFKTSQKTNALLAKSFYELYYNHNGVKSVALLKENKETIKREIAALKKKGGDSKWVAEELESNLDKLIFEVWVNKFPNKNASMDGYELHLFFEKK